MLCAAQMALKLDPNNKALMKKVRCVHAGLESTVQLAGQDVARVWRLLHHDVAQVTEIKFKANAAKYGYAGSRTF